MNEPLDERITVQIAETITAIEPDGENYWFSYVVRRAEVDQRVAFDEVGGETWALIRPSDMRNEADTTRYGESTTLFRYITIATRSKQLSHEANFASNDVLDQTLVSRMTNDIRRALAVAWPTWGGGLGVSSLVVIDRDIDFMEEGWAAAHLTVQIEYRERLA